MIPVSFAVLLLDESGILYHIARFLQPVMRYLGLPGEAALAFISSVFLNIYSAIAVIGTLRLTTREVIILATMCFIAHNFFVECLIMKKTGSSLIKIILLRLTCAFAAGYALHIILPHSYSLTELSSGGPTGSLPGTIGLDMARLKPALIAWLVSTFYLILKLFSVILSIMFLQKVLDEFGIMQLLGKVCGPLMIALGLTPSMGYVWIIVNVVGVAYGASILIEEVKSGALTGEEADLLNHHAAINHSQVEDTLLFVSLGVPYLWAALPRFILAIIVVWLERARKALVRRSFRVRIESSIFF